MNFGNFGNTNCYRYLTSQILAASRCRNYYGPDLFTNKNQPTYNRYQAQQQRLQLQQQQAEQDYLCPSNYAAFISSVNANGRPDTLNQSMRLNQQLGLQPQLGRTNTRCRTDCNEIIDSLWAATKKSSIYVPDTATSWYECQREQNTNSANLTEKCKMLAISTRKPTDPQQFLRLAQPLRETEQRRMDPKRFKHISPEFLSLLEEHENAMLAHNRLYGVDLKGRRVAFHPVQNSDRDRQTYSNSAASARRRRPSGARQAKVKSTPKTPERRGLIQKLSDSCFTSSSKNKSKTKPRSTYDYDDDDDDVYRPTAGQDVAINKRKTLNQTSRIKLRTIEEAEAAFRYSLFAPKQGYQFAQTTSVQGPRGSEQQKEPFCERVLSAEMRRVKQEVAKKAQGREKAKSKRKERQEKKQTKKERQARNEKKAQEKVKATEGAKGRPTSALKELFDAKRKNGQKELKSIWENKGKTRMEDSDVNQQMEDMKKYAETEPRYMKHKGQEIDCEEIKRLQATASKYDHTQSPDSHPRIRPSKDILKITAENKELKVRLWDTHTGEESRA